MKMFFVVALVLGSSSLAFAGTEMVCKPKLSCNQQLELGIPSCVTEVRLERTTYVEPNEFQVYIQSKRELSRIEDNVMSYEYKGNYYVYGPNPDPDYHTQPTFIAMLTGSTYDSEVRVDEEHLLKLDCQLTAEAKARKGGCGCQQGAEKPSCRPIEFQEMGMCPTE